MRDIPREISLFERALVVSVEARLAGKAAMNDPPKGTGACWVHSAEWIDVPSGGVECWVRLQCWDLENRGSVALLWVLFCKTWNGEEHPLLRFYREVKDGLAG